MTTTQQPAAAPTLPWENAEQFVEKPANVGEYGYLDQQGTHGCTREELVARLDTGVAVFAVWTPDAPRLVLPEDVPFLHDAIARQTLASARRMMQLALTVVAVAVGYLFYTGYWRYPDSWQFFLTGIAAIWAGAKVIRFIRARALTPERLVEQGADTRHAIWEGGQRHPVTKWISWCLIAVFICQYISGESRSVEAAGLVKSLVRLGEPWRLLTGPMLHAGPFHFIFNYGALLAFGRTIEVHAGRPYVPLVFILSALGGSVLSTMLVRGTSVGASGGLMGLLGFLLVLATRRRAVLPPNFGRDIWMNVAGMVAFGIVGLAFIDNAGHLGGFLTGAAMGALLIPRGDGATAVAAPGESAARPWSLTPGAGVRAGGQAALVATTGAAALAIAAMLRWWP